jgi:hypothetical protein
VPRSYRCSASYRSDYWTVVGRRVGNRLTDIAQKPIPPSAEVRRAGRKGCGQRIVRQISRQSFPNFPTCPQRLTPGNYENCKTSLRCQKGHYRPSPRIQLGETLSTEGEAYKKEGVKLIQSWSPSRRTDQNSQRTPRTSRLGAGCSSRLVRQTVVVYDASPDQD